MRVDGNGREPLGGGHIAQMTAEPALIDGEIIVEREQPGRNHTVRNVVRMSGHYGLSSGYSGRFCVGARHASPLPRRKRGHGAYISCLPRCSSEWLDVWRTLRLRWCMVIGRGMTRPANGRITKRAWEIAMNGLCRMLRHVWLLLGLVAVPAWGGSALIYVTNSAGDSIHAIDPATNTVVQEIKGIEAAHGIAPSPDGARIYASNEADSTLDVFDRASGTLIKKVPLSNHPNNIAVAKTGDRILVAIAR